MELDDPQGDQEANYACRPGPGQSRCPTPRLHARSAEALLIGKMLQTVLTGRNISRVLDAANDPQQYDEAREHRLTRQDLQEIRESRNASSWLPAGLRRAETFSVDSSLRYGSTPK